MKKLELDRDKARVEQSSVELVALAQAGDRGAFIQLFQSVQQGLYRTACVILENEQDAYDATQETALIAFRAIVRLRQAQFFKTWITRILINECRAMLRDKRRLALYGDMSSWQINLKEKGGAEVSVLEAVNRLSLMYKTVIVLRYLEGYSQKEISRVLGCPVGTVKSRINVALKKLKDDLEKQGYTKMHANGEVYEL